MHPEAGLTAGPAGRDAATPRYRAFISYSHTDTAWANWLLKKLEGYRVSARFHGRTAPIGVVGARLAPVFRDRDELPTTSDLGETIRAALRESATLIVICSPSSAQSRWVQEEIVAFKRMHGERRVFAFIVAGEPKAEGAADDCFSPALRREVASDGTLFGPRAEVVAADAREHADGKSMAFVRLVAGLLGVGFDDLRQRELQRRNRRLTLIAAASVTGMVLTLGLALAAWRARGEAVLARNDARRRQNDAEAVLAFMLGDFRDDLKKVGQLALLEKVGDRALSYFGTADPRDLTDTALARHAKALTQVGDVRLDQARFADAVAEFTKAYAFSSALAARHPQDADMLFERAQAEYWVGAAARRRGDFPTTRVWYTRYLESENALVAIEGKKLRAQWESIYAHRNLAVLDMDEDNLTGASRGFLAERAILEANAVADPGDVKLRDRLADNDIALGVIAERNGEFSLALRHLSESVARYQALASQEPTVARWPLRTFDALAFSADICAVEGRRAEALALYDRALPLIENLTARDPANLRWQQSMLNGRICRAALLLAEGTPAASQPLVAESIVRLEALEKSEPQSRIFTATLAAAWRLEAYLRLVASRPDATVAATRAVELGAHLVNEGRADNRAVGEYALACILAGRSAQASAQPDIAQAHWQRVLTLLAPKLAESNNWRVLDPAAQALVLLDRAAEARPLIERLRRFGYQPTDPLARTTLALAPSPQSVNQQPASSHP